MIRKLSIVVILGVLLGALLMAAVPNEDNSPAQEPSAYPAPVTVQRSGPDEEHGYPAPVLDVDLPAQSEEPGEGEVIDTMPTIKIEPTERAHSLSCWPQDDGTVVCQ